MVKSDNYNCLIFTEFYSRASYIQHQKREHFDGKTFKCVCQAVGWTTRAKFGTHLEKKHGLENARARLHPEPEFRKPKKKRVKKKKNSAKSR